MSSGQLFLLLIILVFCVVGYLIWDRRYRGGGTGDFKPTDEVFRDPTTGRMTRVHEDPRTGARQYREEP